MTSDPVAVDAQQVVADALDAALDRARDYSIYRWPQQEDIPRILADLRAHGFTIVRGEPPPERRAPDDPAELARRCGVPVVGPGEVAVPRETVLQVVAFIEDAWPLRRPEAYEVLLARLDGQP